MKPNNIHHYFILYIYYFILYVYNFDYYLIYLKIIEILMFNLTFLAALK